MIKYNTLGLTYLRPYHSTKFDCRSTRCIFLGYSLQQKGYKCFDPLHNKIYITRHVRFNEHIFPYAEMITHQTVTSSSSSQSSPFTVPYIPLLTSDNPPVHLSSASAIPVHSFYFLHVLISVHSITVLSCFSHFSTSISF